MATLKILRDEVSESPRDWDNLGTMACWHKRYDLGDSPEKPESRGHLNTKYWLEPWGKQGLDPEEWIKTVPKGSVILPLYLYDHSGLIMSTTPFSCSWDSGQVGWIVATPAKIKESFAVKRFTTKVKSRAEQCLISEVEIYNYFLTGNSWWFEFCADDGTTDSCGGFLGDNLEVTGILDSIPTQAIPLAIDAWCNRGCS